MMLMSISLGNFVTLSSFVITNMTLIMNAPLLKMKNLFITSGKDSGELSTITDYTKR